jgi:CRISPR-associated protein Cas1
MQLVLDTHGLAVKVKNKSFHVIGKTEKRLIGPERLTSIAITADCLISTAAIRLAVRNQIPIYLMDDAGEVEAALWSVNFVGLATLRQAQAWWTEDDHAIRWVLSELVTLKTSRQADHLEHLKTKEGQKEIIAQLRQTSEMLIVESKLVEIKTIRQRILGLEGQAAKSYWQALTEGIPTHWRFEGRSRRPAQDPFNAALNYTYGMLYAIVEQAVLSVGLDPYMAVLHAEEYDRPALVFDLIEPFRPWADALLVDLCNTGTLNQAHFEPREGGWWVGKAGKSVLIPRFNDWLQTLKTDEKGERRTVKNHVYALAGQLANTIREWNEIRKSQNQ